MGAGVMGKFGRRTERPTKKIRHTAYFFDYLQKDGGCAAVFLFGAQERT